MTTFLIILAIGFVITAGLLIYSMRKAPLDTDLWGAEAYIMECDSQTRQEILDRHPELADAIREYRATGSWSLPQETISSVIGIRNVRDRLFEISGSRSLPGELVAPAIEPEETPCTDD